MYVLSPAVFYVATAVICGVVALSIGSSWTTAATVSVSGLIIIAVLGCRRDHGRRRHLWAPISGTSYPPLSETTILTSQMVGVDQNNAYPFADLDQRGLPAGRRRFHRRRFVGPAPTHDAAYQDIG